VEVTKNLCGLVDGSPNHHSAPNVISGEAFFNGTIRCHDAAAREDILQIIQELPKKFIAYHPGYDIEPTIEVGYPMPSICDDMLVDLFVETMEGLFGSESCEESPRSMGGEDFCMVQKYVNKMILIREGSGSVGGPVFPLHSGDYESNEDAIPTGLEARIAYLLHLLNR
jgi:amidohydrolase